MISAASPGIRSASRSPTQAGCSRQARSPSSRRRSISTSLQCQPVRPCSWTASPTRAPFVYDTLIGFNHTISAPNQTHRYQHIHLRLMVRRWRSDPHHRRARGGANLHRELQSRCHGRSAGFCAGECGDTADQSIIGAGHLHRRADRREHQHRGHRLEQRDLEYHVGDGFGGQHLSGGGAHRPG